MAENGVVCEQQVCMTHLSGGVGARCQHTHGTFGVVGKRIGPTCDAMVGHVVEASSLLHAQLPTVGVFHSDLLAVRVRVRVVFMRW